MKPFFSIYPGCDEPEEGDKMKAQGPTGTFINGPMTEIPTEETKGGEEEKKSSQMPEDRQRTMETNKEERGG